MFTKNNQQIVDFCLTCLPNTATIINMKKIKQVDIAVFMDVSPQFVSELRRGHRFLSKRKAKKLESDIGVSYEILALTNGEQLYGALVSAYRKNLLGELKNPKTTR